MFRNAIFLVFIFRLFFSQNLVVATDDTSDEKLRAPHASLKGELTLVVGNTREKGQVDPEFSTLVGQAEANFTHTKSFQGRVVSLDLNPLSPTTGKYEHLTLNFVAAKPEEVIQALGIAPTRFFLNGFPHVLQKNQEKTLLLSYYQL